MTKVLCIFLSLSLYVYIYIFCFMYVLCVYANTGNITMILFLIFITTNEL